MCLKESRSALLGPQLVVRPAPLLGLALGPPPAPQPTTLPPAASPSSISTETDALSGDN